jgi:U3 small nucleolar RNA-associated protein 5
VDAHEYFRTINLPSQSLSALARPVPSSPRILCASHTPYVVDVASDSVITLNSHRNPIHSLVAFAASSKTSPELFLAADADRYINVFNVKDRRLLGNLIADNTVEKVATCSLGPSNDVPNSEGPGREFLATTNEDGVVEIFSHPFQHFQQNPQSTSSTSLKAQRKKMTKKSDASLRVIRPDKTGTLAPVFDVSFQGPDIILARAEGGVNLAFERIRWLDEETGNLIFRGVKEIVRGKSSLGATVMNGVKGIGKSHVDDSHAVVVEGGTGDDIPMEYAQDVISISSGVEEEGSSSSDAKGGESESDSEGDADVPNRSLPTGKDVSMVDQGENEEGASEAGEPSFGDLLRAQTSNEPIDVAAAFSSQAPRALVLSGSTALQIPSGVSLATVLTQSLNTNDNNLLESCFHTTDTNIVRTTIQRLDPSVSAVLLQRLAERLSSRPGRYGHLLVWVQWVCVAHGGYIAGNQDVFRKVSSLFRVLDQRCASLDRLLLLKGKLDMLDAQMGLRKQIQESARGVGAGQSDDEGVIYIEGQEEDTSDESEADAAGTSGEAVQKLGADSEDNEDENMPLTVNGVTANADSDDEDEESEEGGAELIDDEAEETDGSSDDELLDEESDEEEDSDEAVDEFEEGISEDDDVLADNDREEEVAVSTEKQKPRPRKSGLSNSFVKG